MRGKVWVFAGTAGIMLAIIGGRIGPRASAQAGRAQANASAMAAAQMESRRWSGLVTTLQTNTAAPDVTHGSKELAESLVPYKTFRSRWGLSR